MGTRFGYGRRYRFRCRHCWQRKCLQQINVRRRCRHWSRFSLRFGSVRRHRDRLLLRQPSRDRRTGPVGDFPQGWNPQGRADLQSRNSRLGKSLRISPEQRLHHLLAGNAGIGPDFKRNAPKSLTGGHQVTIAWRVGFKRFGWWQRGNGRSRRSRPFDRGRGSFGGSSQDSWWHFWHWRRGFRYWWRRRCSGFRPVHHAGRRCHDRFGATTGAFDQPLHRIEKHRELAESLAARPAKFQQQRQRWLTDRLGGHHPHINLPFGVVLNRKHQIAQRRAAIQTKFLEHRRPGQLDRNLAQLFRRQCRQGNFGVKQLVQGGTDLNLTDVQRQCAGRPQQQRHQPVVQ